MEKIKTQISDSCKELKNVRSLVVAAMLIAAAVVLSFFSIQITQYVRIGFTTVANQLSALMFGPVVGSLGAALVDLIGYLIKPTGPFFPGFTISGLISGCIYGFMYYKKPLSIKRVFIAEAIVAIVVNLCLNTYWLSLLYGDAYMVLFPTRIVKQMIMVPVDTAVFYLVAEALSKAHLIIGGKAKA